MAYHSYNQDIATHTLTNNHGSLGENDSSPSPSVANGNGNGLSPNDLTPSNQYNTYQNRSDAPFGLAPGTHAHNGDDSTIADHINGTSTNDSKNNNSSSQNQEKFSTELLSATSSNNGKSKISASSTFAAPFFMILVVVSGALFVSRRGRKRKEFLSRDKTCPLHFLDEGGLFRWRGDEEMDAKSSSRDLEGDSHNNGSMGKNGPTGGVDFTIAAASTAVVKSDEKENASSKLLKQESWNENSHLASVTPRKSIIESNLDGRNEEKPSLVIPLHNRLRTIPPSAASSPNDSRRNSQLQSLHLSSPISNETSDSSPSNKIDDSLVVRDGVNVLPTVHRHPSKIWFHQCDMTKRTVLKIMILSWSAKSGLIIIQFAGGNAMAII